MSESLGLDQMSENWSVLGASKGRYGALGSNTEIAAQVSALNISGNVSYGQSVAKWYPRTVKVADVFAMYIGYPDALSKIMNPAFRYIGIDTAAAPDGTSVATLTFMDSADSAQVVDPVIVLSPAVSRTGEQA